MTTRNHLGALALLGCLLASAPAFAGPPEFDTVADALEAMRANRVKEGRLIRIKKVMLTTQPVHWGYGAPQEYTTWFYVNDRGRDGDGILFTLPNYWMSGADPFDENSEDPYEASIHIPTLHRGYEISISGFIRERDGGKGFIIERTLDDWSWDDEFYDFVVTPPATPNDYEDHTIKAKLTVHSSKKLRLPRKPSRVKVEPSANLKPGDVVVVSVENVGDRGRLLFDGQEMEIIDRRPGILIAEVPGDATPGTHRIKVRNPQVGNSRSVRVGVVAPPAPPQALLRRAVRMGGVLMIKGEHLRGKGALKVYLGNRVLSRVIVHSATTIVATIPAGVSGSTARIKLGSVRSNRVQVTAPGASTSGGSSGIAGSIPGN